MKLIIAGSRDITDMNLLWKLLNDFKIVMSEIISGTAKGVDQSGEQFAEGNCIPLKRFPADWDKYGKSAGAIRNEAMAEYADALLYIWDGKSKGTLNMIITAHRHGLKIWGITINKEKG